MCVKFDNVCLKWHFSFQFTVKDNITMYAMEFPMHINTWTHIGIAWHMDPALHKVWIDSYPIDDAEVTEISLKGHTRQF